MGIIKLPIIASSKALLRGGGLKSANFLRPHSSPKAKFSTSFQFQAQPISKTSPIVSAKPLEFKAKFWEARGGVGTGQKGLLGSLKRNVPPEVLPLITVVTCALSGSAFVMFRQSTGDQTLRWLPSNVSKRFYQHNTIASSSVAEDLVTPHPRLQEWEHQPPEMDSDLTSHENPRWFSSRIANKFPRQSSVDTERMTVTAEATLTKAS